MRLLLQVFELHRLYHNQKMLMKNISSTKGCGQTQDRWTKSRNGNNFDHINYSNDKNQQPRQKLELEPPAEEKIAELNGNGGMEMEDEGEIELTLGLSSYNHRKKAETPLNSDSGLSFSSSSTGSNRVKRTNSGIHRITDRRKEELTAQKWGLVEVPNTNSSFLNGRRNSSSDMEEQLRQDRLQQSPWLFQVLSLNMT